MKIETEFVVEDVEFSKILPQKYSWNGLKERDFQFGGGWRVPRVDELIILSNNIESPRNSLSFWSSSQYANNPDYAWYVHFYSGYYYHYFSRDNCCYVRLVRSGL